MNNVVITGCFDIIHVGHTRLISFGRKLLRGDSSKLIILLDSDRRIKEKKGEERPINKFEDRREIMYALVRSTNHDIIKIDSDRELVSELSRYNKNHIRICGEEYKNKEVIGKIYAAGVVYFNQQENYSTTNIINHAYRIGRS